MRRFSNQPLPTFSPLSGPIGLVCLIVAKALGASQVIITGKQPLQL